MGTFIGHVLPGCFFFLYGLWFLVRCSFICFYRRAGVDRSGSIRLWLPFRCCRRRRRSETESGLVRLSYEGLIVIACALIGFVGELATGNWQLYVVRESATHHPYVEYIHMNKFEHATMYAFFFLVGLVTVIDSMVSSQLQFPLGIDRVSFALAYAVEGLLFFYHLDGKSGLEVRVHVLLIYAIIGCVVATLLEIVFPTSLLCVTARSFCTFLQGSWFFQIAHVLYGSSPWEETSDNSRFVVMVFCWHIFGILVGSLVLFFSVSLVAMKCCSRRVDSRNEWSERKLEEESLMLQLQQEDNSSV